MTTIKKIRLMVRKARIDSPFFTNYFNYSEKSVIINRNLNLKRV